VDVIAMFLMISVVAILGATLVAARQARHRHARLQRDNRAMRIELDRHRETLHSILRELQNP
jgi:uncharacterized membrane protein